MKYLPLIARWILGLIFVVFGLNKFFHFAPAPELAEPAMETMQAFMETGYLFYVLGFFEVLAGALLLLNRFVPLALIVLVPITLNIFLFHIIKDLPSVLGPGGLVFILNWYLIFVYKKYYDPMLVSKTSLDTHGGSDDS